jgi:hypothetical protein
MLTDLKGKSAWVKWVVKLVIALLAAGGGIVALLTYFHPKPINPSLTGTWNYKMVGSARSRTYEGTMRLTQDGDIVSGEMDTPEGPSGATSGIRGTYVRGTLDLIKGTGADTDQEYLLTGKGRHLAGRFVNKGNFADSGNN